MRAFSYFSLLANIAEDVDDGSPPAAAPLAGLPPPPGSVAGALDRMRRRRARRRRGGRGAAPTCWSAPCSPPTRRRCGARRCSTRSGASRPAPAPGPHGPRPRRARDVGRRPVAHDAHALADRDAAAVERLRVATRSTRALATTSSRCSRWCPTLHRAARARARSGASARPRSAVPPGAAAWVRGSAATATATRS